MTVPFDSIAFPPAVDPALHAIAGERDYARHVDQLVRQLLLTDPGERVNRPDFGCGVRRMLFAPNDPAAATLAQVTVADALARWLSPVLAVDDVTVTASAERVEIAVSYTLRARRGRRHLNIEVEL